MLNLNSKKSKILKAFAERLDKDKIGSDEELDALAALMSDFMNMYVVVEAASSLLDQVKDTEQYDFTPESTAAAQPTEPSRQLTLELDESEFPQE